MTRTPVSPGSNDCALDFRSDERLAVYGSLAPGARNAHILSELPGFWTRGTVRGRLEAGGWGAREGYLGLRLSPEADPVPVDLFCSRQLPASWAQLDAFEGEDYRRVATEVMAEGTTVTAFIYVLRD